MQQPNDGHYRIISMDPRTSHDHLRLRTSGSCKMRLNLTSCDLC